MKGIALENIMQFTVGKNPTRLKEQKVSKIYTSEDFDRNLYNMKNEQLLTGCIINLIKSKAAPFTNMIDNKCITSNFLICLFDTSILDPWFFCYKFNESAEIRQQIDMYNQGTTISVKKLTIKNIGNLELMLPDINKQTLIGQIYKKSIIQKELLIRQTENLSKMMFNIISKIEEEL